jgi:hypothetical protein
MVLEHAAGRMKNTSDIRAPDLTASRITALPLREHAADALRRARKLPIGPDRNDLRQLAVGLKWLEKNGRTAVLASIPTDSPGGREPGQS